VLRGDYDQEFSLRKRLEEDAAEDDRRINELEDSLAGMTEHASKSVEDEKISSEVVQEIGSLTIELQKQTQQLKDEQALRKELEVEAHEALKLIASFEKMIRETEKSDEEKLYRETSKESEGQKVQELEATLKSVENQLEQERVEQQRLAEAVAAAEKRFSEQEKKLVQAQGELKNRKLPEAVVDEQPVVKKRVKSSKPLPHELRAAPRKGAFFHPDWALEGLPCQSSEQVFKAWETVFNVQISLEGYTSQYCMAFMVVLRLGKQKKLYMLYRLKKDKHTLVCVPAKMLQDEASLKKAIKEGLKFLKLSGFEMEEMAAEVIDSTLSRYFQGV
jgi:myosin heavy subunit